MLIELVADVCAACPGGPYSLPPFLMGAAGAPTSGPPPGESSDPPPEDAAPDDPGSDDPSPDDPPKDWWDTLFGSDPAVQGAAESIAQDLATGAALDYAAQGLPGASGVVGTLGTIVGGSEVMANGVTVILKNKGRGMGGNSKAGNDAWDALAQEREARQPKSDD